MNGEQLPVVIDIVRVVIVMFVLSVTFFLMGAIIGRRLAPAAGPTRMQLAFVHNDLRTLMNSHTQRMLDEMHSVETKLDGYVVIINASNEFAGKLLVDLKAAQDKNATAAGDDVDASVVDTAITSIETHLTNVSDALTKLSALAVPLAPAPQQPVAAPTPLPADPVAQDAQEAAAAGVTQAPVEQRDTKPA